MELKAAITGNLTAYLEKQRLDAETAVTEGIWDLTDQMKADLRAQVISAGLGNRLAKTWQAVVYPKRQKSISCAGVVFSRAPKLITVFNDGALIKSSKGRWLAIPTENAPKQGIGHDQRINPSNFPEHRYGKLRYVYVQSNLSLLVVDTKSKRKPATKVMFWLVPQVRHRKRLDIQAVMNKYDNRLAQVILDHWPRYDDA